MSASPAKFLKSYFDDFYIDYELQNPRKKNGLLQKARRTCGPRRNAAASASAAFGNGVRLRFFFIEPRPPWQRFGIDASEYALCRAHTRVPEAHLTVSDAAKLPFKGAFDIIVAFDVLEHIMELETIPENIASKLNPGGYFIFVVPVYDGPAGPIIRKLDRDTTHRHKRSRFSGLHGHHRILLYVNGRAFFDTFSLSAGICMFHKTITAHGAGNSGGGQEKKHSELKPHETTSCWP